MILLYTCNFECNDISRVNFIYSATAGCAAVELNYLIKFNLIEDFLMIERVVCKLGLYQRTAG